MEKLQQSKKWQLQKVDSEHFVLIPLIASQADLRAVLQVNESAAVIWDALAEAKTEPELLQHFAAQFSGQGELPEQWQEEVRSCLLQYLELGAIQCTA
jgi:hypothetical protein